jgi:tellurite methyltransferase
MNADCGIEFFDRQFKQQIHEKNIGLNPFEQAALPNLRGQVLDFGCGMGQLAVAAARAGCSVVALDASEVAVEHLRQVAAAENLPIDVRKADLRQYTLQEDFDSIVSIGLLMFFDCPTAQRALAALKAHLRAGGTMVINVLVEGTTYMDMFDKDSHCLFERQALADSFADWEILSSQFSDFAAPGGLNKSFCTVVARKPAASTQAG